MILVIGASAVGSGVGTLLVVAAALAAGTVVSTAASGAEMGKTSGTDIVEFVDEAASDGRDVITGVARTGDAGDWFELASLSS